MYTLNFLGFHSEKISLSYFTVASNSLLFNFFAKEFFGFYPGPKILMMSPKKLALIFPR